MGFWDKIMGRDIAPIPVYPQVQYLGGAGRTSPTAQMAELLGSMSTSAMWETQPHLRTVVSFLARNVAQLGLHSFEMVDGTDRRRDRTSPLAATLHAPDLSARMTTYDLVYALVADLALYDCAYWLVATSADTPSGYVIRRLPPSWVMPIAADPFTVKAYRIMVTENQQIVPASNVVAFRGYHPANSLYGSAPLESLRGTLREQMAAAEYRLQVWERGGRVSSVLQRPADAPDWTPEQRDRFATSWYAKFTGRGPEAGGTPILEDGMTLNRIDFNAKEQQFIEAAQLAFETVAGVYHVNPSMIGRTDGTTFASMRELHRMLYVDTLGPLLRQIEDALNSFLIPLFGMDSSRFYLEFNVKEKLRGSFEDQAQAMQGAVGGPWMTRNEARARENLPSVEGGDELIVPLNVLEGGQASPLDAGSQNLRSVPPQIKAAQDDIKHQVDIHRLAMEQFFKSQADVVLGNLRRKAPSWWDEDSWNAQLADSLYQLALTASAQIGRRTVQGVGLPPNAYNVARTSNYLRAVAESNAANINAATLAKIKAALAGPVTQEQQDSGDSSPTSRVGDVFDEAKSFRAGEIAQTAMTFVAGFAKTEAARQQSDKATKTWITGENARPSHARMDGETVGIDDVFSNGLKWPGAGSDAAEVANCNCSVDIQIP